MGFVIIVRVDRLIQVEYLLDRSFTEESSQLHAGQVASLVIRSVPICLSRRLLPFDAMAKVDDPA